MDALKLYNVTACLDSAERLFQYFTPRNEKHFWPFKVLYNGSFKSVEGPLKLSLIIRYSRGRNQTLVMK